MNENAAPIPDVAERLPSSQFMGIPLTLCTVDQYISWAENRIASKQSAFVTYLNAWCSNISSVDNDYRRLLHSADCVYADGMGVVWGAKFLGLPVPERVNAADFILQFLEMCAANGYTVGLIGSADGVAASAARQFQNRVPNLKIVVALSGYLNDDSNAFEMIRQAGPDVLLVGMGVPLQEKWVYKNRDQLTVPFIWCIGAMFEFYSGYTRRAPAWMCRLGLEWLFRLCVEPKRMARRYLMGNAVFIWRVLRAKFN